MSEEHLHLEQLLHVLGFQMKREKSKALHLHSLFLSPTLVTWSISTRQPATCSYIPEASRLRMPTNCGLGPAQHHFACHSTAIAGGLLFIDILLNKDFFYLCHHRQINKDLQEVQFSVKSGLVRQVFVHIHMIWLSSWQNFHLP